MASKGFACCLLFTGCLKMEAVYPSEMLVNFYWTNRVKRVVMMVYNTQNYWGFGLYPSSSILETIKHNVLDTGSISVLRCRRGGDTYFIGFLRKS
jgi:hypothetical protein